MVNFPGHYSSYLAELDEENDNYYRSHAYASAQRTYQYSGNKSRYAITDDLYGLAVAGYPDWLNAMSNSLGRDLRGAYDAWIKAFGPPRLLDPQAEAKAFLDHMFKLDRGGFDTPGGETTPGGGTKLGGSPIEGFVNDADVYDAAQQDCSGFAALGCAFQDIKDKVIPPVVNTVNNVGTHLGNIPNDTKTALTRDINKIHNAKTNIQNAACAQTCSQFDIFCTTQKFIAGCQGGADWNSYLMLGGAALLAFLLLKG
jgi:hypothetical protein